MKKRLLKTLLISLILLIFTSSSTFATEAEQFIDNYSTITLSNVKPSATPLTIEQLRAKFPDGMHWNHKVTAVSNNGDNLMANRNESFADSVTNYPCATHSGPASVGQYDCNYFDGGIQCFGFAYKLGYDYTGGIRPSTWTVQYSLDNIQVGDIIRYNNHSVFVIAVNNYGGISVAEANYGYDCSIKWDRYITKSQITNFEWVRKCPTVSHTHSYTSTGYEAAHPHKEYKICSCGSKIYTGNVKYLSTCSSCNITNFTATVNKSSYYVGDVITFSMNSTNATAYAAYIAKDGVTVRSFAKNASGEYTMLVIGDFEPGCYEAVIQARNGAYTKNSEKLYFTVKPQETKINTDSITVTSKILLPSTYRKQGQSFTCGGTIESKTDFEYILFDVYDEAGKLATGYSVFPTAGTKTCNLSNFTSKLNFQNLPLGTYTMVIRAKNSSGVTTLVQHRFFITPDLTAKLKTPVAKLDTKTMESGNLVTVSWDAVSGASEYIVSVIQSPCGWSDIKQSAMTKDTSYAFQIFEPGTYSIFVVARDSSCYRSEQSVWQEITVTESVNISEYEPIAKTRVGMKEYTLYDQHLSWRMADSTAKAMGGSLAMIESEKIQETLYNELITKGSMDRYWIGGTDFCDPTEEYKWTNGNKLSYTNWNSSEPTRKKEHWMMIYKNNGKWNDLPVYGSALSEMGFIVEKQLESIPVEEISLNYSELTLEEGKSQHISANTLPTDATNSNLIWSSTDNSIATVENGVVTAIKEGATTINVSTEDGSINAQCTVTVTKKETEIINVSNVTLNQTNSVLDIGESITLIETITPTNATNKAVTWYSSDPSIATVNNGTVTALRSGTTIITVTTEDGSKEANCTIIVNQKTVESISLTTLPTKLSYYENENLDLTGGSITITYNDNNTNTIPITEEMVSGFDSTTASNQTLTVTYSSKTTTFNIEINHKYKADTVLPTCTSRGYTIYTCKCGSSYIDNYRDATGHTVVLDYAVKPSCIEEGLTQGSHCSKCGEILAEQKIVEKSDHYEVIDPAIPSTCKSTGLTEGSHCSFCGQIIIPQSIIEKADHIESINKAVAPTCTESGLSDGSYCIICNTIIKKQNIIAALGHSWDNGIITIPPTHLQNGIKIYTCTRCGISKTEAVPSLEIIIKFTDVPDNAWFASSVYDLAGQGIISGMTETTFVPNGLITRAQFAKIIAAASGENISSYTGKTSFSDVSPSAWYASYVQWAYEKGIVKGISDTSFAPEANITREQMAAMICRYAAYKGVNLPQTNNRLNFKDDASISGWAKDNVYAMQQAGIINGYADGNGYIFKPQGNATRAEAAKMISAFLSLK